MEKIAFAEEESKDDAARVEAWENGQVTPVEEGISRAFWLHRPAYEVGFWVQNTGSVFGGEVKLDFSLSFFFPFYLTKKTQT